MPVRSYIGDMMMEEAPKELKNFGLEPFEMKVQGLCHEYHSADRCADAICQLWRKFDNFHSDGDGDSDVRVFTDISLCLFDHEYVYCNWCCDDTYNYTESESSLDQSKENR